MNTLSTASAASDISRFTGLRAAAHRDPDAAFSKVAKEFEALFIQMMLKAARDASPEGGLFDSRELKLYREMMDDQVALSMAEQGGLGFESILRRQFAFDQDIAEHGELTMPEPRRFPSMLPMPLGAERSTVDRKYLASTADRSSSGIKFVDQLLPMARDAASKLGVEPHVLVAQAALETGWGKHVITASDGQSSHNYFGIKATNTWTGESVRVPTLEFIGGRAVQVNAEFRAYPDASAAFDDYVRFIREQPRYASALDHGGDAEHFIRGIADAGYATDPRYAAKILSLRDQIRAQSMLAEFPDSIE